MKNFYMKYQDTIIIIINVMIIVLGLFTKNRLFSILGVVLLIVSVYVFTIEKKEKAEKARLKAEQKALRDEQKRLNKGKKKKKKKKR